MALQQKWKRGPGSNRRRADYGSAALPLSYPAIWSYRHTVKTFLSVLYRTHARQKNMGYGSAVLPLKYPAMRSCRCLFFRHWQSTSIGGHFPQSDRRTDHEIGLILGKIFRPLINGLRRSPQSRGQCTGSSKDRNRFILSHEHSVNMLTIERQGADDFGRNALE